MNTMIIRRVTMDDLGEVVNLESAAFKMTKEQPEMIWLEELKIILILFW